MHAIDLPNDSTHAQPGADAAFPATSRAGTCHGSVRAVQGGRYLVVCPAGLLYAAAAASCLLVPRIGDRVLVSSQADEHYILSVLQQADPARSELRLGADVAVHAASLRFTAPDGMALEAGPALRLTAGRASLEASSLLLEAHSLKASAHDMALSARHRSDVSVSRRDVAARVESHHGDSVRRVSGHDEQTLGSARIVVAREWRVRADRADLLARRRVKVDADKVDLG